MVAANTAIRPFAFRAEDPAILAPRVSVRTIRAIRPAAAVWAGCALAAAASFNPTGIDRNPGTENEVEPIG
jgi:hypothetical protein